MTLQLEEIRVCFEGAVPATVVTCSLSGTVNITPLSHVYYIDSHHVALSAQFFNKTKNNLQENPFATVMVMDPFDLTQYTLELQYLRTETEGKTFSRMTQKLENVATATGMTNRFRLRGADIYRVMSCAPLRPDTIPRPPPRLPQLSQVASVLSVVNQSQDMEEMFDQTLQAMEDQLGYRHSIVYLLDNDKTRLYTVASHGYGQSGAGSEMMLHEGIAGTVAGHGRCVCFSNLQRELTMSRAIQKSVEQSRGEYYQELKIPLPGLSNAASAVAAPIEARGVRFGVLYVESEQILSYFDEDQDAITAIAQNLAMALAFYQSQRDADNTETDVTMATADTTMLQKQEEGTMLIRYYEADHSVFLDTDYLIKGVAGCILWKLLQIQQNDGRTEFTNRELRRDKDINLPDIGDNLEARLILLRKRLDDRCELIRLEKCGRGRFHLIVNKPLELRFIPSG